MIIIYLILGIFTIIQLVPIVFTILFYIFIYHFNKKSIDEYLKYEDEYWAAVEEARYIEQLEKREV